MGRKNKSGQAKCNKKIVYPCIKIDPKWPQVCSNHNGSQSPTNPPKRWVDSFRNSKKNSRRMTRNAIYKIRCEDCDKCCLGQTERKVVKWMDERKYGKRRQNPLPLISVHKDQKRHIQYGPGLRCGSSERKAFKKFSGTWHSSASFINRRIKVNQIYNLLKPKT